MSACVVSLQEFWELVCSLLLHKHSWIRLASGRLLGMYFGVCGENNRKYSKSKASLEGAVDCDVMFSLGLTLRRFLDFCSNDTAVNTWNVTILFHV